MNTYLCCEGEPSKWSKFGDHDEAEYRILKIEAESAEKAAEKYVQIVVPESDHDGRGTAFIWVAKPEEKIAEQFPVTYQNLFYVAVDDAIAYQAVR